MALLQTKQKVSSWLNTKDRGSRVPDIEEQRCYGTLQDDHSAKSPLLPGRAPDYLDVPPSESEDTTFIDEGMELKDKSGGSRIDARIISDAILGLSDGLTVPFALSAGLSAFGDAKVVVLGSLAELVAGAISMGLGGYVGAKSEVESYFSTKRDTQELVRHNPSRANSILHSTLSPFNIPPQRIDEISASLQNSPEKMEDFIMSFHHRETAPNVNQAWTSAVTLALGYFVGGFIPLIPYFIIDQIGPAFAWSAGVMAVTLFVFGYVKTCIVRGWRRREDIHAGLNGALQMLAVGGIAAGSAVGLVRAINRLGDI
ncbi:hypothetical protein KEM56_003842 [Ascosphaera pollenicola]|nr:hypothetical protein KEM56_003842 [Ascosphaera pollenicola]